MRNGFGILTVRWILDHRVFLRSWLNIPYIGYVYLHNKLINLIKMRKKMSSIKWFKRLYFFPRQICWFFLLLSMMLEITLRRENNAFCNNSTPNHLGSVRKCSYFASSSLNFRSIREAFFKSWNLSLLNICALEIHL